MNCFKKLLPPASAFVAMVSTVSVSYLANRVLNTSQLSFLALQTIFATTFYTPIMFLRNKMGNIKDIGKKEVFKITLFVETPAFITEFSILKMYENSIALPTAIFSSYPIFNILKDKLTPKINYTLTPDNILINKAVQLGYNNLKDVAYLGMYAGSIYLLYLDHQQNPEDEDSSSSATTNAVIFAAVAAVGASVCGYFTHKYGHKHDAEVLTYSGLLGAMPLRVTALGIAYASTNTITFQNDFIDNIADMRFVVPLSALDLLFLLTLSYAYSNMHNSSDCAMFSTIVENTYSLLLDKGFNFNNFTPYSYSGVALGILSCIGFMLNNRLDDTPEFLNVILSKIDNTNPELMQNIMQEWESHRDIYNNITPGNTELDLISYNKVLLAVLSKLLSINFDVVDRNGTSKLAIRNTTVDLENEVQVRIQVNFDLEEQQTTSLIVVSEENIEYLEETVPLAVLGYEVIIPEFANLA